MARILLIDDDPDIRTIINILLKKHGFEVETASTKTEAFEKLYRFRPAIILLDVLLNGADGRIICKEIKAQESMQHLPVIMFSAHPGAGGKIAEYGADDFITKPLNTQILLDKVNHFLNQKQRSREA